MNSTRYNNYNKKILICFIFCINLFSISVTAQKKKYTVSNAHAHNDYVHPILFYTAYNAGFGSIEADIFPVTGILCVAHSKREIQLNHTLKNLYLDPLLNELFSISFLSNQELRLYQAAATALFTKLAASLN